MSPIMIDDKPKIVFEQPEQTSLDISSLLEEQMSKFQNKELNPTFKPLSDSRKTAITPKLLQRTAILPISGYSCVISPFKFSELETVRTSFTDTTTSDETRFRVAFNKIEYINANPKMKLDFENWCKMTSLFDFETLLEALFIASFPGKNKTTLTCRNDVYVTDEFKKERIATSKVTDPNTMVINGKPIPITVCDENFDLEMFPEEYRAEVSQGIIDIADELVHHNYDINYLYDNSVMAKSTSRIRVGDMFIEYKIPSIERKLAVDRLVPDTDKEKLASVVTIVYFITSLIVPDIESFKQDPTAGLQFSKIEDIEKIFEFVDGSGEDLIIDILDKIQANSEQYRIAYRTKEVQCPKCGGTLPSLDISPSELILFKLYDIATKFSRIQK